MSEKEENLTLAERLREAIQVAGMTQAELALRTGRSCGAVTQWLDGTTKNLKADSVVAIEKVTGYRAGWLATGHGPKRVDNSATASQVPGKNHQIPLISHVQAGSWSEVFDPYSLGSAEQWITTDLDLSKHAFALEIRGDSMEPEFRQGDRIIIEPKINPRPGDFVVAKNGANEATFKKYRPRRVRENGEMIFELRPLNEDYPTISSEDEPITIIGVMVEHRKYRYAV